MESFQKHIWIQDWMQEIFIPDKNPFNSSELWMKMYAFDNTT